ncbi:hypothetical protein CRENBAI_024815 [Crenichthys baileyi]|uniref:Transmembrane channel-like protein n=1 Tax=Crenichthys baileyi TaxID=28760 RepID=A0AAV9SA22_9TELE
MARSVDFDLSHTLMEAGLESPADEDGVHDSFSRLIAEQSQSEGQSAIELQDLQRDLEEEGQDHVAHLSGPEYREWIGSDDTEEEDNERQTDSLIKEPWSSATMKILSSMPSRTIGHSRGAIISQYYNRTMLLRRRRQSRPAIKDYSRSARPSIRGYGMEADTTDSAERKQERLVNNLQNLPVGDRVRMLRAMPLNLAEKTKLRRLTLETNKLTRSSSGLLCCSRLKLCIIIALRHSCTSTGNLPPELHKNREPFTGLELLTGTGYFSDTLMYYGYYSNYTLRSHMNNCTENNLPSSAKRECESKYPSYNMPLAYFFTIGMVFFITCIILVYSMSKSFGQSFRIDKSHSMLAMKAFCSWDFKVVKKSSVKLMSENIYTQLKELLAEVNQRHNKNTALQKLWRLMVHGLAWTICIAGTTGCVIAIYFSSDYVHKQRAGNVSGGSLLKEASLLALPVLVSLINLLLPGLFNLAAWMEEYNSPSVRTYVAISRNLMLKVSVLGVLCYHWLSRVAYNSDRDIYIKTSSQCWESFVGQELYRFLIIDFIFTLLNTLFGELLWRIFSDKVLKNKRRPGFDIAKNVLDLIYGQTLAWLGVLFTPLLPAVQVLKLLLLFYIKMSSVMMNCQAPRRPYRVSQMTTIFITLLCFPSFLGASVCVTYTMWSINPSESCGPFRGRKTMFQAGKHWIEELEKENPHLSLLARAHTYLVENPFFLFVGAAITLIVIYFHSQVVDGQRKIITLLQEQIENVGKDKKFLITRLQSMHEQKKTPKRSLASQDSGC